MQWIHKDKPKQEWSKWFAWHPVPIGKFPLESGQTIIWLQFVERKWIDCRGSNIAIRFIATYTPSYEYRKLQQSIKPKLTKVTVYLYK
jgi:hypothetical protein